MNRNKEVLTFLAPWIIGMIFLIIGPAIASILLSFCEWDGNGIGNIEWVGVKNYENIFKAESHKSITPHDPWYWKILKGRPRDPLFYKATYNTLIFTLFSVPLALMVGLGLAILVNQPLRGVAVFRTLYYLPHILGGVGMILLWQWMFNPEVGLLNRGLQLIDENWSPQWLYSPKGCKPALIVMQAWGAGGVMLVFLAALQNISAQLYEAAELDGTGRWRRFVHITLPQISPAILFNLVVGVIGAMRAFKAPYLLRHWSQDDGLLFYMLHVYQSAFEAPYQLGYASALVWILAIGLMLLSVILIKSLSRWVYYESAI